MHRSSLGTALLRLMQCTCIVHSSIQRSRSLPGASSDCSHPGAGLASGFTSLLFDPAPHFPSCSAWESHRLTHCWRCRIGRIRNPVSKASGGCAAGVVEGQPLEHLRWVQAHKPSPLPVGPVLRACCRSPSWRYHLCLAFPASKGTLLLYQQFPAHPMRLSHKQMEVHGFGQSLPPTQYLPLDVQEKDLENTADRWNSPFSPGSCPQECTLKGAMAALQPGAHDHDVRGWGGAAEHLALGQQGKSWWKQFFFIWAAWAWRLNAWKCSSPDVS